MTLRNEAPSVNPGVLRIFWDVCNDGCERRRSCGVKL